LGGAGEDPQLRQELVQGIDDELVRLQGLLNELAHLHDQVLGSLDLKIQPVILEPWFSALLPTWQRLATDKHLSWHTDISSDLVKTVQIDPDRMAQVVENLLSNAIRYTPHGGNIWITLASNSDNFTISIRDSGPGIQPEEAGKVFEPFQRGKAAQRLPEGMGLGLSIAHDLVQAHCGTLTLENVDSPGTCLVIRVPLNSHSNDNI
jgi:signal transduction histidine kinase